MDKINDLLLDIESDQEDFGKLWDGFNDLVGDIFGELIGFSRASDAWDEDYNRTIRVTASDGDESDNWDDDDVDTYKDKLEVEIKADLLEKKTVISDQILSSKGLGSLYAALGARTGINSSKELWDGLKDNDKFWEMAFSEFRRYDG